MYCSKQTTNHKCSDIHAWSCSRTVRARADAPASMCRPCTLRTLTPLAQDGRQVHTCRAESALDRHSGFVHAVTTSVQTKSCGQCDMRAPLHRCTALPPGSHSQNLLFFLSPKQCVRERRSLTFHDFHGNAANPSQNGTLRHADINHVLSHTHMLTHM